MTLTFLKVQANYFINYPSFRVCLLFVHNQILDTWPEDHKSIRKEETEDRRLLELIESQEDISDTYDPEEKYVFRYTGHRCGPHQGISLMVGPNLFWTKGFSGPALKKLKSKFQKDRTGSK